MLVPKEIANLETLASKDATRYAINGVLLERDDDGKARAVVTDGRRLLVSEWPEADEADYPAVFDSERVKGFSAILPTGALKTAANGINKRWARFKPALANIAVSEKSANGQVFLTTTDMETESKAAVRTIEGDYPNWREIMPKYKALSENDQDKAKSIRIGVNAKMLSELLMTFVKLAKGADCDMPEVVCLEVPLSDKVPLTIHSIHPEVGKVTAILMPVNLAKV